MSGERQLVTDSELWDAIRRNEESAFKALYDRYWSKIYSTAYSYLHDKEACAEIVHDIFMSIWLKRHRLEIASFSHYLTAASRYRVYKQLSQKGRSRIIYQDILVEENKMPSRNEGEDKLHYKELQASVDNYLLDLPERCREIFYLSRKEQLSIAEIAERLGISRRTVENQLTRALLHLRHSLGDLYVIFMVLGSTTLIIK